MPSPFPGMNPYLEGNLWTTFHFSFAAEIVRQLVPRLRPKYILLPGTWFIVEAIEQVPHVSIEIRDTKQRTLVTAIEFLSPTNKRNPGRREYLKKRQQILLSSTHLLESDLLRRGQRMPMQRPLPPADFFVFLSRANNRPLTGVWPLTIQQALPTIPIPLLEDDPDAQLDVQHTFATTYDLLGYNLAIDYQQPPDVPFTDEQAAWADTLRAA